MSAVVITVVYLVVGSCGALVVLVGRRRAGALGPAGTALLCVGLWPFMLPTLFAQRELDSSPIGSTHRARVDGAALQVQRAMARSGEAGLAELRARQVIDAFAARLRSGELRLVELEHALGEGPASARARLEELRCAQAHELELGLALLEELAGKLTVLSFTGLATPSAAGAEREAVEELLCRIEALADLGAAG